MKYKVTALQDVRFLAHVRGTTPEQIDGKILSRPIETEQWISLKAGTSRRGLGMPVGVDPDLVPDAEPMSHHGVRIVLILLSADASPQEFFGLLRIEQQDD